MRVRFFFCVGGGGVGFFSVSPSDELPTELRRRRFDIRSWSGCSGSGGSRRRVRVIPVLVLASGCCCCCCGGEGARRREEEVVSCVRDEVVCRVVVVSVGGGDRSSLDIQDFCVPPNQRVIKKQERREREKRENRAP